MTLRLRHEVTAADEAAIRDLVAETCFFSPEETEIAGELVREWVADGDASGYRFIVAEDAGGIAGYSCHGPIPGARESHDLYWIAVRPRLRRNGLGRRLLAESERQVRAAGGRRLYVDTSSRPQYEPTRRFYARCGYRIAAELDDFYAPGDGKVIFLKVLD